MSSTNATVVKVVREAVLFSKAEFMTSSGKSVTLRPPSRPSLLFSLGCKHQVVFQTLFLATHYYNAGNLLLYTLLVLFFKDTWEFPKS